MGENTRMPEEERMGENTRMPEDTGIVKNTRMPENAGRAEGDNLPGESMNQKKQEPKQEFPGSMDSLLWAMYKTEPLQVEDDRKVKKTAISQKPGKTEKKRKNNRIGRDKGAGRGKQKSAYPRNPGGVYGLIIRD